MCETASHQSARETQSSGDGATDSIGIAKDGD
jgi:hypothetical protein